VWRAFTQRLIAGRPDRPLRVLEAGAGLGGMIERLLEWTALGEAEYIALDSDPGHAAVAARRLQAWAEAHGAAWTAADDDSWAVEVETSRLSIRWVTASLFDRLVPDGPFDVVLAHAFLDLVDLDRALPRLLPRLGPGGTFLFTLNFDGLTAFLPEIEPELDRAIVEAYHATMDTRRHEGYPSGSSRTGRRLLAELPRHGAELLAAGSSDWIIYPGAGGYSEDERLVLETMLATVGNALEDGSSVAAGDLARWLGRRREQVASGELIFLAHQIDVLGRVIS
jgi:SAM-dependent methyltransferase